MNKLKIIKYVFRFAPIWIQIRDFLIYPPVHYQLAIDP